jgi:hypothetical protein
MAGWLQIGCHGDEAALSLQHGCKGRLRRACSLLSGVSDASPEGWRPSVGGDEAEAERLTVFVRLQLQSPSAAGRSRAFVF